MAHVQPHSRRVGEHVEHVVAGPSRVKAGITRIDGAEHLALFPVSRQRASMDRAIQLLTLLQRDGRLVDFLLEDLTPYTDAQISAAVRDVHANCRRAIDRYLPLEPILADEEGMITVLGAPVDPSTVKLVGNVGS